MNESSASDIALAAFATLTPVVAAVYWFAVTFVTKKNLEAELLEVDGKVRALEKRLTEAEKDLSAGRAEFAGIRADLRNCTAQLANVSGKLDKLLFPRVVIPGHHDNEVHE